MASDMNEDMIYEILLRMPTKSLTKFKLQSKDLLSLISSAQFRRLHTLRNPKPPLSFLLQPKTTSDFFYFNFRKHELITYSVNNIPNPKSINSCNGLMLVQSDRDQEKHYYVLNPTTNQSREIIPSDHNNDEEFTEIEGLNLAFDPSKSLHYKIACIKRSPSSGQCRVEVYDSASHAWVRNSEPFTARAELDFTVSVYCNDKIHWSLFNHDGLYYDVSRNAVRNLPPKFPRTSAMVGHFQEFNGRLHHFTTVGYSDAAEG